ncbi:6-bladed beta-propeller [uncultured Parabacteroides sp.]|uniref:6-bladed beta-propeller n=1 Tax=uncultured Parabacteroides sp. TaxID=512312 RepID=UPI0025E16188|nr:6-bladed beta-propeller [uncultured Parabacteroides sp.]
MKRNVFLHIALLFLLSIACSLLRAQTMIPFAEGVEEKKEIKLSEVASDIRYIPLETTAESLLEQDILDITFAGGYLFVSDYNKVLQFTPEGSFIRQIGKAGQGPGEYNQNILAVAYDEANKQIFLSDMRQGKVLVYSFDGAFIKDIKTAIGAMSPYVDAGGNLFTVSNDYLRSKERKGDDLFVYSQNGKRLYGFPFHFEEGKNYPGLVFVPAILYPYNGNLFYKNPLEETVFRLDGKKKVPVYRLDLSRYEKLSAEEDKLLLDTKNKVGSALSHEKKFYFYNLMETDKSMGVYYAQEDERRFAWYDKQTGKVCRVRSSQADKDGFTDDREGGCPVLPYFLRNGKLVGVVPASVLLEKVKPANAKGSLRNVLDHLLEDDNQVIQVVTLK